MFIVGESKSLQVVDVVKAEEKKLSVVSEDFHQKRQTVLSHKKLVLSDESDHLSDLEALRSKVNSVSPLKESLSKEKTHNTEEHRLNKISSLHEEIGRKRPYDVSDERRNRSDLELIDRKHSEKRSSDDPNDLRKHIMKKLGSDVQRRNKTRESNLERENKISSNKYEREEREVAKQPFVNNVKQKDTDHIDLFKKVKSEVRKKEKKNKKSEEKSQKRKKSKKKVIASPEEIQPPEAVKLEKSPSMDDAFVRKDRDIEPITSDSSLGSVSRSPSKSPTPVHSRSPSQSPTQSVDRSGSESPPRSISRSPTPKRSPTPQRKRSYLPAIEGCRSVEEFTWLNRIEEGTYGVVYRARDRRTGYIFINMFNSFSKSFLVKKSLYFAPFLADEVVALKRLKMEREREGFPITSLREINCLLKAQHPNIVTVRVRLYFVVFLDSILGLFLVLYLRRLYLKRLLYGIMLRNAMF